MSQYAYTCPLRITARFVGGAAVIAAALLTAACSQPVEEAPGTVPADVETQRQEESTDIGDVTALNIAGLETLLAGAENKVLVINFWATWCVPCVAEMPYLAAFYQQHDRDDVVFLALSLDSPGDIDDTVTPFMHEHNIPFPAYVLTDRDIEAISKTIGQEIYGVLPTTIVYDRRGAVRKVWEGAITLDDLNGEVTPLL